MALRRFIGDAANDETGCDLRYQGQLYDAESGLYYNRHRYYDPEIGQYISSDPIGLGGGLRPQGYVHNPVEWVDPFGLEKKEKNPHGTYRPDRPLPRDKNGNPIPDADAPHTQLGTKKGRKGDYTQGREWGYDENGSLTPKRDIDFTDHGRPKDHSNPHQHDYVPNSTGGTQKRDNERPLEMP